MPPLCAECKEMYLGGQNIDRLTGFERFVALEILWLNDNELTAVTGLEENFRIKELYLHNNKANAGKLTILLNVATACFLAGPGSVCVRVTCTARRGVRAALTPPPPPPPQIGLLLAYRICILSRCQPFCFTGFGRAVHKRPTQRSPFAPSILAADLHAARLAEHLQVPGHPGPGQQPGKKAPQHVLRIVVKFEWQRYVS